MRPGLWMLGVAMFTSFKTFTGQHIRNIVQDRTSVSGTRNGVPYNVKKKMGI